MAAEFRRRARLICALAIMFVPLRHIAAQNAASPSAPQVQRGANAAPASPQATASSGPTPLKISKGSGILPNDHGQVWREYEISPYTQRILDAEKPQQAVVDWVLRETGTETWFGDPLGILSATKSTLRVYHTPDVQQRVQSLVERFVRGDAEAHTLGVRLITVSSPNWRARAIALVKPVDVKSPGVEAWLMTRENASLFYEQLNARGDFREHNAPRVEIANGQSQTLARTLPRKYVRSVQLKREFPFYDLIPGQFDEGYSLKISPLASLDGKTMEAAIDCHVDQIEKLLPLAIDVPIGNETQRVQIQVPQFASWRLSERFRWPANEVLLLSCGVVATPAPTGGALSVLAPLGLANTRADALLLVEHNPPSVTRPVETARSLLAPFRTGSAK